MKQKIAVAVSGGVDSLVTAYLLKKQNKDVIGLHFLTGYEHIGLPDTFPSNPDSVNIENSIIINCFEDHPIYGIAKQLNIPVHLIDCRQIFKKKVVDYFNQGYLCGKTPNPCMICNLMIKFGIILDIATSLGASHLATGHYARIEKTENDLFRLKKGLDAEKDQSYFLAFLSQKQLSAACFPLGDMTKKQVIELARRNGLSPISSKESQDICFIKNKSYSEFLSTQEQFIPNAGPIKNTRGEVLGHHTGLHKYTIGQRKGLNCPASEPYYVVKMNAKENTLVIGFKKELYKSECTISNINWMIPRPSSPVKVSSRIRYRHRAVESTLIPLEKDKAVIRFNEPQPAVAPGQAAVCYQGDEVIAGGFIDG